MIRLFIPVIFIGAAIALFVVYTNPTYTKIKNLQVQENSFDAALTKAQELRSVRDDLLSKRSAFLQTDVDKLTRLLPDNVDNIRLIIDIGHIAARHGLQLSGIDLGDLSQGKAKADSTDTSTNPIGNVTVGFSVDTNYDTFLGFVQDLEHSMRLLDIQSLSFTSGAGGTVTYTVSLRTYWLH